LKVAVVGGSIVGCAAAASLRNAGCDVTVLERSSGELRTRGSVLALPGGLIPRLLDRSLLPAGFVWRRIPNRQWIVKDGDAPMGRCIFEQPFTVSSVSWAALFADLRAGVPDEAYRKGCEVTAIERHAQGARVVLAHGEIVDVDLVVAADGYLSTVRDLLFGTQTGQSYSGYVVWRGWFDESDGVLAEVDHLDGPMKTVGFDHGHGSFWIAPSSAGLGAGRRQVTWNFYGGPTPPDVEERDGAIVSVPPGHLSSAQREFLHSFAHRAFPPLLAETVVATPQPALTPVYDVTVPGLTAGRVALVGDAGTVVRPVTGSGAVKGLEDVLAVTEALVRRQGDVDAALADFDAERLPVGLALVALGQRMGTALVDDTPDWASMSAAELERWLARANEGWYAIEEATARAG
jgi:2-polyprenyl-6-methoxyphenol hydroxylase-like FAD-dependent oxidoreductase